MKNKWIAGILALTLLFTLTACSGSSGSGTTTAAQTTAAQTTAAQTTAAAPAAALEKTDFNLGYLNSTAHLLAFVAQEEGFFEEEGLRVTLTQFSSAAELPPALRQASWTSPSSAPFPR